MPGSTAGCLRTRIVALHPEGVDRNWKAAKNKIKASVSPSTRRAWIEINSSSMLSSVSARSPSTRRAWIEMPKTVRNAHGLLVALHPEGVDRNTHTNFCCNRFVLSPSTRRAWIEM